MKKILILILFIFLLSGCSVEYNLEFKDNIFIEKLSVGQFDSNEVKEFGYFTPYATINHTTEELYKFDYSNNYLKLSYNHKGSNFEKSIAFNECYELSNISYDDKYYYILTSNEFKCMSYLGYKADEVKINFKSDHVVVEANADYVDGNTYTWVINNNNSSNKPIKLKMVKEVVDDDKTDNNEDKNKYESVFLIILGVVVIGVLVVGIHIYKRIGMRNKI